MKKFFSKFQINETNEIKRLISETDMVRRERVNFDNVFQKLEYDIMKKEKELK